MTPQNITQRYTNSLLRSGKNNDFSIWSMTQKPNLVKDQVVGHYFEMTVCNGQTTVQSVGATPEQALERALTDFGVTFA